jgi:hypothetical protein
MEWLVGTHAISSEPVQTLVMPTDAGTAALRTFVTAGDGTGSFNAGSFLVLEALLLDHANISYSPKLND